MTETITLLNFPLCSDAALIPAHPRTIDSLVRRQDSTRKDARERKKERKEEKLLRKREEVKRMKALKMKELREKLERIGKEGGKNIDEEGMFASCSCLCLNLLSFI